MRRSPMPHGTSTLKRTPWVHHAPKKGAGLAQRIAESLGRAIKHVRGESNLLRDEQHRRNVAALPCAVTDRPGPNQCAHVNFGKGMGLKVCDSLCFPLSPDDHREHDQGGNMTKQERWRREWEYVDATRALLIQKINGHQKLRHIISVLLSHCAVLCIRSAECQLA